MRLPAFVILLAAGPTHAATVHVEARLRGDRVIVAVFYADNSPAADAGVIVRSESGKEIATGQTDDRGEWMFPKPDPGKYTLRAEAAGNRVTVPMTIPTAAALRIYSPPPDEIVVTGGPDRTELTRLPWLRPALAVAAGLTMIVILMVARRRPGVPKRLDA
jgi:hypothetical protein